MPYSDHGILTNIEIRLIDRRMDAIDALLCDEHLPDDVNDSLDAELNQIISCLERSYLLARINESGFKIVS